jgi:hypothetical protein
MAAIIATPVLFIVAVHHRATTREWPLVGKVPPGTTLPTLPEGFIQDMFNPRSCQIIDVEGNIRAAVAARAVVDDDHRLGDGRR